MAAYLKTEKIGRWKGTLSDIVDLTEAVKSEVTSQASGEPRTVMTISGDGLESSFDEPSDALSSVRREDLVKIEHIRVAVGDWVETSPLSAHLVFSSMTGEPAVLAQVRGGNRVQVEGLLSATIRSHLNRGRRRLSLSNTTLYILGMLTLVAVAALWISAPIEYPDVPFVLIWVASTLIGGFIGIVVMFGVNRFANWMYPQLELLLPGEKTKFETSKKWLLGATGSAIVAPVAGGIVLAWVT